MTRRRRQPGFTLLEMLIALAVIGLIMLLLFGGLRLASRTWEGVESKAQATEAQRLARGFLRRSLLQARQQFWRVDGRQVALFFGDREQLEFVTPLSGHVGLGGLYVMRIGLQRNDVDGADLILQRWLLNTQVLEGSDAGIPQWQPLERPGATEVPTDGPQGVYGANRLVADIQEIEWEYFGNIKGEREARWHEEWRDQPSLPTLVRLRLLGADEWPDMVVALVSE